MLEIYAVRSVERIEDGEFQKLLGCLTAEKQEKVKRFHRWEDSQRAAIAEILIRAVVCTKFGFPNGEIDFDKNDYGKPFIKNRPDFHYNISHSGDWVICAVDNALVGIDVETVKPMDFGIAKRFFSKEECNDLMMKEESQRLAYFFDLWTLKESYIKADGRGMSIPLDSFTIKVSDEKIWVETDNELKDCFFKKYNIDEKYKCSVCSVGNDFPSEIIMKNHMQLYEEIVLQGR